MSTASLVKSCSAATCAFNDGGCTAYAITVGGASGKANCVTYVALDARAAVSSENGQVGTCHRLECVHNADLLCTAGAITVSDTADCQTYAVA